MAESKQYNIRFPDDFFEALEQERQKQHKPASFIIREALAEYLNKRGYDVSPEMNWGGVRDKDSQP
jgi:predicted DNA-binding protein